MSRTVHPAARMAGPGCGCEICVQRALYCVVKDWRYAGNRALEKRLDLVTCCCDVSVQRQNPLWKLFKDMPFGDENSPPTASATLRALQPPPFKSSTLNPTLRASHTSAPPCHNCAGTNPNFLASKNSGEADEDAGAGRKWRDQAVFRLNPISVQMSGGAIGEERMMSQF